MIIAVKIFHLSYALRKCFFSFSFLKNQENIRFWTGYTLSNNVYWEQTKVCTIYTLTTQACMYMFIYIHPCTHSCSNNWSITGTRGGATSLAWVIILQIVQSLCCKLCFRTWQQKKSHFLSNHLNEEWVKIKLGAMVFTSFWASLLSTNWESTSLLWPLCGVGAVII